MEPSTATSEDGDVWISPRPKESHDEDKFAPKPKKIRSSSCKGQTEIPMEDIPKLRTTPLVLTSPRKPFPIPNQNAPPEIYETNTQKEKKKKRKSIFAGKGTTPIKTSTFDYRMSIRSQKRSESQEEDQITDKKPKVGKRGKINSHIGDFLLNTDKEGFLNVKEKNSKRWHRRWVALSETLRCHKDIVVSEEIFFSLFYLLGYSFFFY